jgi:CRISPR system Cascade subunit CasD
MQSWGVQSRFGIRDTGLEPSKSGVIGLLCAALGRPRNAPLEDLASLTMGVRVDQQGSLEADYHTAQNVLKASGGIKDTEISRRYYLAGAIFLVGLESEDLTLLDELHTALRDPVWLVYLGRKAFIPSPPVYLPHGLRKGDPLLKALQAYPWLGGDERRYQMLKDEHTKVRVLLDAPDGEQVRPDLPISFSERRFAQRRVHTDWIDWPLFSSDDGS